MGVPMEGFFDGAEAVLATPTPPAAHKAPAKTPTPSAEPVPREGTHVEGVGETTPLPAKRFTPLEGAISCRCSNQNYFSYSVASDFD